MSKIPVGIDYRYGDPIRLTDGTKYIPLKVLKHGFSFEDAKLILDDLKGSIAVQAKSAIFSNINDILVTAKDRNTVLNIITQVRPNTITQSYKGKVKSVWYDDDLDESFVTISVDDSKIRVYFNHIYMIVYPQ